TPVNPEGQHQSLSMSSRFVSNMLIPSPDIENKDFLNKLDENIQKIIKEQVKAQVSKILPKIEKTVNEQLEAEIESNKSIHRSDEQKNLYKALVDAYECDKLILDTYGDTVTLKRRQDDEDKDEEPSAGSNRGFKRRRARKEPESTSAPKEKTSKTTGKSTEGSKSYHKFASESAPAEEPMHTTKDLEEPAHQEFDTGVTDDKPVEEASQHPNWFQKQAKPLTSDRAWNKTLPATHGPIQPWIDNVARKDNSHTLTPELLAGPTYELMKGSCKSLVEFEFFLEKVYKATTDQLDRNNPEGQQYPHDLRKPLPLIPTSQGHRQIMGTLNGLKIWGLAQCGVKCRLAMTNMHSEESRIRGANVNSSMDLRLTGNLLEMSTPNVESSLSQSFKSSNGTTTSIWIGSLQLTNLTVDERLAFNVSLRMFTRSIVIQRRVEDLQLRIESYQKKINLTKPDDA
nr:hypothetical protein [Tanacetum cinerariifolium]